MYDYIPGEFVHGDDVYLPDEYMDEKWWYTPIPGYMISDHGRVWSEKSQRFLKPKPMDRQGHLGVCLNYRGKQYYYYIHRLMAEAFIANPDNKPVVRHLDDERSNNELRNLAWGTQRDNWRDCLENGHVHFVTPEERERGLEKSRKPILAIDLDTGEELHFRGQQEASRVLGLQQANIWKVLNGCRPHTCGWYFEYLDGGRRNG